jgi:type IV secretory pathway component VirB8
MTEDYKKIAESIRNGTYFGDARRWYEAVYIGPISERSFFLIIAILATVVAIFGIVSVKRLMPITKHQAVLIRGGDRAEEVQASLVELAPKRVPMNPAIAQFFVATYVQLRESYDSRAFTANARFIKGQSNDAAYAAYAAAYDPANAASPFAEMGDVGQRQVVLDSVAIKKIDTPDNSPGRMNATVVFTTESTGVATPTKTRWTANIEFIYTELTTKVVDNAETRQKDLQITDPHFQVVNYVLQQNQ